MPDEFIRDQTAVFDYSLITLVHNNSSCLAARELTICNLSTSWLKILLTDNGRGTGNKKNVVPIGHMRDMMLRPQAIIGKDYNLVKRENKRTKKTR